MTFLYKSSSSISTHAPYTEGDSTAKASFSAHPYFNSRPLYRGRHRSDFASVRFCFISTHAPYTEGDECEANFFIDQLISTHAPYTEGDVL